MIPRTTTSALSASCCCEFSQITHLTHIRISTAHLNTSLSEDGFGLGGTRSQNAERYTNYHKNSTSVLGPEVSESDVQIAGTWTMFVIMSVKGSWYHGPEHLCYQWVVEENYHTLGIMSVNGSLYQDNNRQQNNILSHGSFFPARPVSASLIAGPRADASINTLPNRKPPKRWKYIERSNDSDQINRPRSRKPPRRWKYIAKV